MHTSWKEQNNALVRTFEFTSFTNAMVFVNKVADIAEEVGHHPRIEVEYITVTLTLSTHETGGTITDRDRELANRIDMIV